MTRPDPVRLREAEAIAPAPDGARVIDAKFKEVGGERRTILGRVKLAVIAVFWAAVIGFAIPPAWMLVQAIGDQFAP